MPTLVVWGEQDPLGSVSVAQAVTELIPHADWRCCPPGTRPGSGGLRGPPRRSWTSCGDRVKPPNPIRDSPAASCTRQGCADRRGIAHVRNTSAPPVIHGYSPRFRSSTTTGHQPSNPRKANASRPANQTLVDHRSGRRSHSRRRTATTRSRPCSSARPCTDNMPSSPVATRCSTPSPRTAARKVRRRVGMIGRQWICHRAPTAENHCRAGLREPLWSAQRPVAEKAQPGHKDGENYTEGAP